ncbi:MAG: hypothetical protein J6Z46_09965 [Lachnospiraceae bacterium]|nr:hypothetical protein [Lachnospiraceae bacterium]
MIRKYRLGDPIETESVVCSVPVTEGLPAGLLYVSEGCFKKSLNENTRVYGLGETVRGINKRGWKYISNCTDDPVHTETKHSLYAAQNFILVWDADDTRGYYFDTPCKVEFDVGYERSDELVIRLETPDAYVYEITPDLSENESKASGADNPCRRVVRQFRHIIGRSYIPSRWAFGYG